MLQQTTCPVLHYRTVTRGVVIATEARLAFNEKIIVDRKNNNQKLKIIS